MYKLIRIDIRVFGLVMEINSDKSQTQAPPAVRKANHRRNVNVFVTIFLLATISHVTKTQRWRRPLQFGRAWG